MDSSSAEDGTTATSVESCPKSKATGAIDSNKTRRSVGFMQELINNNL
jgi:hypothetical protein